MKEFVWNRSSYRNWRVTEEYAQIGVHSEDTTTNLLWLTTWWSISLIMLPFRSKKGRWEEEMLEMLLCVCGRSSNAANECGIKRVRVYEEEAGSGPFIWKGRPNSSSFQANQGGMGSTLIGWSESCERSLKGCRGHGSGVQITCPSSLWMTYHYCKVSERARQRGVINVSEVHTFCL